MATTQIDRPRASQPEATQPHDRAQLEAIPDAVATLSLCALLIAAGFVAIYVGGDYVAYLLGVDR